MSNLKAGDMAVITKPLPCCGKGRVGYIFTVERIGPVKRSRCIHCRNIEEDVTVVFTGGYAVNISRVKKIDPPEELDMIDEKEELYA